MFVVEFFDDVHGDSREEFATYMEAQDYWNAYADTETCYGGEMYDSNTGEVIWKF